MNQPSPGLWLSPRSAKRSRRWYYGGESVDVLKTVISGELLVLAVKPGNASNFSSLTNIVSQLLSRISHETEVCRALKSVLAYAGSTGQMLGDEHAEAHQRLMADGVTHAIMRRISRESVYTGKTIDEACAAICDALSHLGDITIVLPDVEKLDRLSLKVLSRCVLVHQPDASYRWAWWSPVDPTLPAPELPAYLHSRTRLLHTLIAQTQPELVKLAPTHEMQMPTPTKLSFDIASVALVMQNYDAVLLCGDNLQATDNAVEAQRLVGLALLNVTNSESAIAIWQRATQESSDPIVIARLHYLTGLVCAKKNHDLERSDREYHRGIDKLSGIEATSQRDVDLEVAWLCNGLALNQALRWRANINDTSLYKDAFGRIQSAYSMITKESSPARHYLRYNLMANTAFLLEMAGDYSKAIAIYENAFDLDQMLTTAEENPRLRSTLNYRIGLLRWKQGDRARALAQLKDAANAEQQFGLWFTAERIERALGCVALDSAQPGQAFDHFSTGMNLAVSNRSREGTLENGRGAIGSLVQSNQHAEAATLLAKLVEQEGLDELSDFTLENILPNQPSPKLPAYIPEIDLEGAPAFDINRFLGNAQKEEHREQEFANT